MKTELLLGLFIGLLSPALALADTFQDLVPPSALTSYATGKGTQSNGGGNLSGFTIGPSASFYIGGWHYYNNGLGILTSQSFADNVAGQYVPGTGIGASSVLNWYFATPNLLGNWCTDTALQGVVGTDNGLRAIGSFFKSPTLSSSTVPNPNLDGSIYIGDGAGASFGWGLIDSLDTVADMMVGDPNAGTVYIQTDGGNESPPSTGFQAYGVTNWNIPVSTSIAKPAKASQYYHPMTVAYGSDGVTYLFYVDASGNIYEVGPGVTAEYSETHAGAACGLCTSGVTSDHHLYMAWVSSGAIYADVFTVGSGGALTAVATDAELVPTSGVLAGLSASSQGLFVDSFSSGSLEVGWITPSGSVLSTGSTPGQAIDTGLSSTGYVDGISAIGGTSPMVFATAARGTGNSNAFYAISATSTSAALTVTSYIDTAHTDYATYQGAMGACLNGSGYSVGKAYLVYGPAS